MTAIIVTTDAIVGHQVKEIMGVAFGTAVRSRNVAGNFMAGVASVFGGKQKGNINLLNKTRDDALQSLSEQATSMGGNAVLSMRFDSGEFDSGNGQIMDEVVAYGTVVRIEPKNGSTSQ